jgi:hypothetical protein
MPWRSCLKFREIGGTIGIFSVVRNQDTSMKPKTWLIFLCIQIAGFLAIHLGSDWSLVLGVGLLLPGLPGLYLFSGIHRLILIGDVRLALLAVAINAAVWQSIAVFARKLKKHS